MGLSEKELTEMAILKSQGDTIALKRREVEASEIPNELTAFQEFLLTAPVMTDEDYNFFLEKIQSFNKWK